MRVVYVKAPFNFEIRDIPVPEPQENEVLVEIMACAVCGSDIHTAENEAKEFASFGHEIAGIVVKKGANSRRFCEGDKVVIESSTFCHVCDNCRNGRIDLCTQGISILDDLEVSGYSDYMVVPEQALIKFDGLKFREAALAEPLGVALDLIHTAQIELNDEVLVAGLGPIGLMSIALAKACGARNVYAVQRTEKSRARIELAKKLGATDVIITSKTDLSSFPFPKKGINKLLVTAPPKVLPDMIDIAAYGAIIVYLGIDMENGMVTFDANKFHFKKLQLRASFAAPALWLPKAIELLKDKVIDPGKFITHTFKLEQIEEFFLKQRYAGEDVIKMVMVKKDEL